jgi:hypothetical protein
VFMCLIVASGADLAGPAVGFLISVSLPSEGTLLFREFN